MTVPADHPCPLCRSGGAPYAEHNGCHLFECGGCGSVYMDPMPSAETVGALYDDAYEGASSSYFTKVDKKLRRSRGRLKWLRRYVRGGRLLDVGCNGGFLTEAVREAGFEAHGLDLDPVSIRYAAEQFPGCHFHLTPVEELADAQGFDLIYCSEVIEHVPDPHPFAAALVRLLRPGDLAGLEAQFEDVYSHTAIALQPTLTCRLPRAVVERLDRETPRLHRQLVKRWHESLRRADESLTLLSTGNAKARMARLLLSLVERDGDELTLFGRDDMGAMLGITTETASRVIADFRRGGLLAARDGNRFRADLDRLRELAEE